MLAVCKMEVGFPSVFRIPAQEKYCGLKLSPAGHRLLIITYNEKDLTLLDASGEKNRRTISLRIDDGDNILAVSHNRNFILTERDDLLYVWDLRTQLPLFYVVVRQQRAISSQELTEQIKKIPALKMEKGNYNFLLTFLFIINILCNYAPHGLKQHHN